MATVQIKQHKAVIPAVGQTWINTDKHVWEIIGFGRNANEQKTVTVVDLCDSEARKRKVTLEYFSKIFQTAEVWVSKIDLKEVKLSVKRLRKLKKKVSPNT